MKKINQDTQKETFHRDISQKMNSLQKTVYWTFNELLAKDSCFKIHDRNLQKLLTETFKVKMKLAPEIMNEVFDFIECR